MASLQTRRGETFLLKMLKIGSALRDNQKKLQSDVEDSVKRERKRMEGLMRQQKKELRTEYEETVQILKRQLSRSQSISFSASVALPEVCELDSCKKEKEELENELLSLKSELEDVALMKTDEISRLRKKIHHLEELTIKQTLVIKENGGKPVEITQENGSLSSSLSFLDSSQKTLSPSSKAQSEYSTPEDRLEQMLSNLASEIGTATKHPLLKSGGSFLLQKPSKKKSVLSSNSELCASCDNLIQDEEESISACNKFWHSDHFKCHKCSCQLEEYNFFESEEWPFCSQCYQQKTLDICPGCKKPIISSRNTITALGQLWHTEHFICTQCKTSDIQNTEFFPDSDNNPFCRKCYLSVHGPRCPACNQPVLTECVKACGSVWHIEHFKCEVCKIPFGTTGNYFEFEKKPYCQTHYYETAGLLCAGCKQPISGRCVNSQGKRYHPDCLRCNVCTKTVKGKYLEKKGIIICQTCKESGKSSTLRLSPPRSTTPTRSIPEFLSSKKNLNPP